MDDKLFRPVFDAFPKRRLLYFSPVSAPERIIYCIFLFIGICLVVLHHIYDPYIIFTFVVSSNHFFIVFFFIMWLGLVAVLLLRYRTTIQSSNLGYGTFCSLLPMTTYSIKEEHQSDILGEYSVFHYTLCTDLEKQTRYWEARNSRFLFGKPKKPFYVIPGVALVVVNEKNNRSMIVAEDLSNLRLKKEERIRLYEARDEIRERFERLSPAK